MTLTIYESLEQGSEQWLEARRGLVTASAVGKLLTATGQIANNDTSRGLTTTLVAERITGTVEDVFVSADMERGNWDEPLAREHYSEHVAPVTELGFMVLELEGGAKLGYSPDGLVGEHGLIEVKSRRAKAQINTILSATVPAENMAQLQAGLLVSGRRWIDYVSWCGGLPMWVIRIEPDPAWQTAIIAAATKFEATAAQMIADYNTATAGLPATERTPDFEEIRI